MNAGIAQPCGVNLFSCPSQRTAAGNSSQWVVSPSLATVFLSSQRCGLGHVPLPQSQSVGGQYTALIPANRLIDQDPFWIGFAN
jgi:hypothetical protein